MKKNKEIKCYADITDDDCVYYTGTQIKNMYRSSNGFNQLKIESVKNGRFDEQILDPLIDIENDKSYKCFEYSHYSGAYIYYKTILMYLFYNVL